VRLKDLAAEKVGHQRLPDSEVPTLNLDKKYFAGSLKLRSAGEVIAKCREIPTEWFVQNIRD
jgi:hypothetical protein